MRDEAHTLIVKKKRRFCISKNLNINRTWNIIGPIVAQEIGAPDYTPIPYCFDTNAYKIGNIFVPTSTQVTDYYKLHRCLERYNLHFLQVILWFLVK